MQFYSFPNAFIWFLYVTTFFNCCLYGLLGYLFIFLYFSVLYCVQFTVISQFFDWPCLWFLHILLLHTLSGLLYFSAFIVILSTLILFIYSLTYLLMRLGQFVKSNTMEVYTQRKYCKHHIKCSDCLIFTA